MWRRIGVVGWWVASAVVATVPASSAIAVGTDLVGPTGSACFGSDVQPLPNGDVVVTDPCWKSNIGAVYLYDGATHTVISTLTGSVSGDRVGSGGVSVLWSGNFVVESPLWDNAGVVDAGAVTWGSQTVGASGAVSATNSLVGSTALDSVGHFSIRTLRNGNYLVQSPEWDGPGAIDAGALTWGDGATGVSGAVGAANSLVGSAASDEVGGDDVEELANGNYVVSSPWWDNGGVANAGAVTWADGAAGIRGPVSTTNSLVGSSAEDLIGRDGLLPLTNGNYVVASQSWRNGAITRTGAVTWGNGATGTVGAVTTANSLTGIEDGDFSGIDLTPLTNGNFVVTLPQWDNGGVVDAGAATWGDGSTGIVGHVSASNSLVGSSTGDRVGSQRVAALAGGNYVVASPSWRNGAVESAGAATWGDGISGAVGAVTAVNSLVGSTPFDRVGSTVTDLTNGNYVVNSPFWSNGLVASVGAVTWSTGTGGIVGPVSAANSLVGSTASDSVGHGGVHALTNGNYVVSTPNWHNGAAADAGAVTWGDGAVATVGPVSAANSLVGSSVLDQIGSRGIRVLSNGNYVVPSPMWNDGAVVDAGAATWGNGAGGTVGPVASSNSLVGTTTGDAVGDGVLTMPNGNYVVESDRWNRGSIVDAGAATWGDGAVGTVGAVSESNSLVGASADDRVPGYVVTTRHGDLAVMSGTWDSGQITDAGAVTPSSGDGPIVGVVSAENSVVGAAAGSGSTQFAVFEPVRRAWYVAQPAANRIAIVTQPGFVSLVPARLLETRPGQVMGTVDGRFEGAGAVAGGTVLALPVTGRGGVGADAASVVLNVAVTGPQAAGFVTVFPCGSPRPTASSLNYAAGQTISNAVTAKIGADGSVCVFSLASADVIVDVVGYSPVGSGFVAVNPARVLETRAGEAVGTVDGRFQGVGQVAGGSVLALDVAGRAGVPADASSVVLNVAVTGPQSAGFVTLFPCGSPQPTASSLNYAAGETIANMVVARVGADGRVCVFSLSSTDVVIDVVGFHGARSTFVASSPQRVLETRPGQAVGTVDGQFEGGGAVTGGSVLELQIGGRAGVLANASTVVLNVAVTEPVGAGFVTVFPCGSPRPLTSSLNYAAGQTIANDVTAKLGVDGKVCVFTPTTTQVVIDLDGADPVASDDVLLDLLERAA